MQGQDCGVEAAYVAFTNANLADNCCHDIEAMTTRASQMLQ